VNRYLSVWFLALLLLLPVTAHGRDACTDDDCNAYVDPDVAGGDADGSSWANAYGSLSVAEAAEDDSGDLVTDTNTLTFQCKASSGSADTTAVTLDGFTTSATYDLTILVDSADRHDGKYNTSKYRLEVTGRALEIKDNYVRVEGLQVQFTATNSDDRFGIKINGGDYYEMSHTIIKGVVTGTSDDCHGFNVYSTGWEVKVWNNIIYDVVNSTYTGNTAFYLRVDANSYFYNNTAHNSYIGFYTNTTNTLIKNNIANDCTDGFSGSFHASSDYNASDIAGDAAGANSRNGADGTVTFENEGADDFHLDSGDSNATDQGVDLSGTFSDDIDEDTRSGSWDIGADEYVAAGGGDAGQVIRINMF